MEDHHSYQHQNQPEDGLGPPNENPHIHSDLDFLGHPFVNEEFEEYFREGDTAKEISSPSLVSPYSESMISAETTRVSSFSGNHKNILGSVLHLYNKK